MFYVPNTDFVSVLQVCKPMIILRLTTFCWLLYHFVCKLSDCCGENEVLILLLILEN